jgi:uncharacterized protein YndB with AHSA1/START domain
MSANQITVDAAPAQVYAVLMDAFAYADWVIGSKRIRAVDDEWPAVGARFHHTVGVPGVDIDDSSKLTEAVENRRVSLEVRFRPIGIGHVTLELAELGPGRTRVTMIEEPRHGALEFFWSKPLDWLTSLRNARSLERLARLSEQRSVPAD